MTDREFYDEITRLVENRSDFIYIKPSDDTEAYTEVHPIFKDDNGTTYCWVWFHNALETYAYTVFKLDSSENGDGKLFKNSPIMFANVILRKLDRYLDENKS